MQQGLYGPPRHVGPELAAGQVRDHLLVGHTLALLERQDLIELETGELLRADGREVGPRTLDPEDVHLAPGVVALSGLGRGVAAAVVGYRAVRAEQVGAIGERLQL